MCIMEYESTPFDLRLRSLLSDANLSAKPLGGATYDVCVPANLREWVVNVRMTEAWVALRAFVMNVPESAQRRKALLETAMLANGRASLTKFSLSDDSTLCIELEYRQEHLDSEVLRNLVYLLVQVAEDEYPRFFRVATAEAALDSLESAFNRSQD
jgi:hypothetical protein